MQRIISKYGLAAHLAFLAVAPLFLSETAILWVAALAAVAVVMEPSRVGAEMLHDARRRVARGLLRDPLFWVGLALVGVAAVRVLNSGVDLVYDAEVAKWSLSTAKMPFLPGSAVGVGTSHLTLACVGLVVIMGCRLALGRSARSAFVLVATCTAGCVALVRLAVVRGNGAVLSQMAACSSADPVYEGSAYGIFLLLSVAAIATVFERHWWRSLLLSVVGIGGTAQGLFFFAPPQVIVLFAGASLLMLLYVFVYLRIKVSKTADFRCLVVCGLVIAFSVMLALALAPNGLLEEKVAPFRTGRLITPDFLATRETLSRISAEVWRAHPWLGTGLGSYSIDLGIHARPADWQVVPSFQTAPLNGFWLLLAERGVVGAFMLVVPLVILLTSYVRRLIGGIRRLPHPLSWVLVLLLIVGGAEMMVDASLLSPKALLPFLAAFTISANAFAKENGRNV